MTPVPAPRVHVDEDTSLEEVVRRFLPRQGGIELQRDEPGKIHDWHSHDVHETLVVLRGGMDLEFVLDGRVHEADAGPECRIELPRNTVHRSTARAGGCVYVIVPEDGRVATTTRYADPVAGTVVG
jgi:quercetin dioxygenase-like cupin family protein